MGGLAKVYREVVSAEDSTPRAMGAICEAGAAIREEGCVCVIAPRLRQHVSVAQRDSTVAIGTDVLSPPVAVGRSPSRCRSGTVPICVGADSAIVSFASNLCIVVSFEVFPGP